MNPSTIRLALAGALLIAACHSADDPSEQDARSGRTLAERAASIALARAQIERYRRVTPPAGSDRCFDLKNIVRTLRAAQLDAARARWTGVMRTVCVRAHVSADL